MRTADLDYDLPDGCIAQVPREPRDSARLLVAGSVSAGVAGVRHGVVHDLPDLLSPGDLLVINTTKVLPARVQVQRSTGGSGEVLLIEDRGDGWWEALCRPSRKLPPGAVAHSSGGGLTFEFGEDLGGGRRLVRPWPTAGGDALGHDEVDLLAALERDGQLPLPPYIRVSPEDPSRYQTTYADRVGSSAAPTAGLHMTESLLERIAARGVRVAPVELVVGLDTFRPVLVEQLEDHPIHTEHYRVPEQTWHDVGATRMAGGRVVAVGTTTTRALESVAHTGDLAGRTSLFITPGFEFRVVDQLMTNFHLPRSSLLAMIEAFTGTRWRDLYELAIREKYRFLSFGDAMLLEREVSGPDGIPEQLGGSGQPAGSRQ